MKTESHKRVAQPASVTPDVAEGMVRQHPYQMYRDKLPDEPLTLENWVLAEKDLVASLESDGLLKR